ncbi:MAG: hypothetical protein CMF67_07005 [Magnetovibrio sp.]|nr:hypothetical protein [Magnetovibrio sp.]
MSAHDIPPVTDEERSRWPAHGVVKLEKPFIDARGMIQPLVDEMMRSAVMIKSKAGSIRANHYHKTDWHYCYVIAGQVEYFHRPTGSNDEPAVIVVNEGEMVFTPPMVDHGMRFPVDTVFLTLGRNPRDQATYESDVVRVEFVPTEGWTSWSPGEAQSRGDDEKGGDD